MRSTRVTTFGTHTSGTIDYQNVSIVAIGEGKQRVGLGYPVVTASPQLPRGGLNENGIPPDVTIDPEVRDPIDFVRRYCEAR